VGAPPAAAHLSPTARIVLPALFMPSTQATISLTKQEKIAPYNAIKHISGFQYCTTLSALDGIALATEKHDLAHPTICSSLS